MKNIKPFKDFVAEDKIQGGLADNLTAEDIANMHGVSVEHIEQQIALGLKDESEHTNDPDKQREIAMDHLVTDPNFYTKEEEKE